MSSTSDADREAAMRVIQEMIDARISTAMESAVEKISQAVDNSVQQHMHAQGARVSASSRGSTQGGSVPLLDTRGELLTHLPVSLPLSGANPASVAGVTVPVGGAIPFVSQIPTIRSGNTGGTLSSSSLSGGGIVMSVPLNPATPLSAVLPVRESVGSMDAVVVGGCSPPIPRKMAEKIWKGEFIDLNELLPSRLGAPELTMWDLLGKSEKPKAPKKIETFPQWSLCFNTYISVHVMKHPNRVQDLLAYASSIAKASTDYQGVPWLAYDSHFRRLAAAKHLTDWSDTESSLYTRYFAKAQLRDERPVDAVEVGSKPAEATKYRSTDHGASSRYSPYPSPNPICRKWNDSGCVYPKCKYRHVCLSCNGNHRLKSCEIAKPKAKGKDSSFRN